MNQFKFLQKPTEYTINIQFIPMFKVQTYERIYQHDIDKWIHILDDYILLPNTEENRNAMMNKLAPYFLSIKMIYCDDEVV